MMLSIRNLTLRVGNRTLLENADLEIGDREKVALAGPSGCGKTTLLRAIIGWQPIEAGSIVVDGMELSTRTLPAIRGAVAYVQQRPILPEHSVREVLLAPFSYRANRMLPRPDEAALQSTLALVNLPPTLLDAKPSTLSGGERQRLSVVRSLLVRKRFFLTDEVTSGLDPDNRARIVRLFMELPVPMLMVTHNVEILHRQVRVYLFEGAGLTVADPARLAALTASRPPEPEEKP